jgi:hypothetical protein
MKVRTKSFPVEFQRVFTSFLFISHEQEVVFPDYSLISDEHSGSLAGSKMVGA